MASGLDPGEHYRLEHRVGGGGAPDEVTIIRRKSAVTVDSVDASGTRRRHRSRLVDGVYDRIVQLLHQVGFPEAPRDPVAAGRSRIVSAIANGREQRTRPIAHATSAAGWNELFALLDQIAAETSHAAAGVRRPDAQPVVTGAGEVALFAPSPEAEEPPLGEDANDVVASAWQIAAEQKHREITPAHLLVAFARGHGYQLARLGLDPARVLTAAEALFTWDPEPGEPAPAPAFELVQSVARRVAAEAGEHEAGLRHFLRALLEAGGKDVTRVLQEVRLPDAMVAGKTRDRIFALPAAVRDASCTRCGEPSRDLRWCLRCGRALARAMEFSTGSPLDHVLPVALPHDWPERERAVSRSLCSLPDQAGTPWLGFRFEAEREPSFVTPEDLERLGVDRERLEQNAIANLSRIVVSWTPRWVPGPDGREVDVLFCAGEPHACERLLERAFLLHAQAMLGTNALAAAIPERDLLLLTRLSDLTVLMALGRHYYSGAGERAVTPWGFAIQDGAISGPISSG